MGCTQSVPSEHGYDNRTLPLSNTHSVSDGQTNFSTSSVSLEPLPLDSASTCIPANSYEKILSSPGRLELSPAFSEWFPCRHSHINANQLFKYRCELGHGVTASVHEIEYKSQVCALKRIPRSHEWSRMAFTTEARTLTRLKHEGIMQFIDMFMDEHYYYLLLEKGEFDLHHVMHHKLYLSESKTNAIIYALLKAVHYLHQNDIAHRDLKPENIVFAASEQDSYIPKLVDFGDAERAKENAVYTEFVGTPRYMAPERLCQHNADELKQSDIWAIGVMAYECFAGQACFVGDSQKQIFARVLRNEWRWPVHRTPSSMMQLFVQQCLQTDTKQRLSAKEALNHPWFADLQQREDKEEEDKEDEVPSMLRQLADLPPSGTLHDILLQAYVDKLSDDELNCYRLCFERLDVDQDGLVTTIDLTNVLRTYGVDEGEASWIASQLCSHLNRGDFTQFLHLKLKYDLFSTPRRIFDDILSVSSSSDSEMISCEDIRLFSRSHSDLRPMLAPFDDDGDGLLTYSDFVSAVHFVSKQT